MRTSDETSAPTLVKRHGMAGRRAWVIKRFVAAMMFVCVLIVAAGACDVGVPCGEGYCLADYRCLTPKSGGEPVCVEPDLCGNGVVDKALGEVCDAELLVTTSCAELRYDFGRPGCSSACDSLLSESCGDWNWTPVDTSESSTNCALWGSGPSDVFVVGFSGTVVHYDGASWQRMGSGTVKHLNGVWGSGPSDVFAVGESGTVVHYDGASWKTRGSGTGERLYGVWGSGPSDVFAVGDSGTVVHYDGARWQPMDSGTKAWLYGVWGSGPSDVFAVGAGGVLLHYDGLSWLKLNSETLVDLNNLWGQHGTFFAVGDEGAIYKHSRVLQAL